MTSPPIAVASRLRVHVLSHGALWHVQLAAPKGNVVDSAMAAELAATIARARDSRRLAAIVLSGDGPHFSFGASVAEHLPEQVAGMLRTFHAVFRAIVDVSVVVLAAVRGQCLGGGLELAAFSHRVFAAPDARFALPEITLGVFAPAGSLILPERIGRAAADDLCTTGRAVNCEEALRLGLVDAIEVDPVAAALGWAHQHLLPHSARSLRFAVRAARRDFHRRFLAGLDDLEELYLGELLATADGAEGIRAFLDKRAPQWNHA